MEKQQRQNLNKALRKRGLDAVSIENHAGVGTPDVNFIGGWAELKYMKNWPARASSKVALDHYTPQQRVWSMRRWVKEGAVWLVLQVSKTSDWLVFDGRTAAEQVGKEGVTKAVLFDIACFAGKSAAEVAEYIDPSNKENAHYARLES